jgi:DNA-directed RNA polymerase specialized sigma24 family protein
VIITQLAIQKALIVLTKDECTLLYRKADGWTPAQIADELNISHDAAYKRLQRDKQRFQRALAKQGIVIPAF